MSGERTVIPTGQIDDPRPSYAADSVRTMGGSVVRGLARFKGRESTDDFDADPVTLRNTDSAAASGVRSACQRSGDAQQLAPEREPIIWFAGVGWDDVVGTDRRLVEEIAKLRPVAWLDPPNRAAWTGWLLGKSPAVVQMGGCCRFRVPATYGVTRWPMRPISWLLQRITFARVIRRTDSSTVVVANPITRFPRSRKLTKVFYVTDDWVAGADMMGLSVGRVSRTLQANSHDASALAAVSPLLLEAVCANAGPSPKAAIISPNGSPEPSPTTASSDRLPIAGAIGQLNERLDLALLKSVADAGIPLRLVGPRTDRDPTFSSQLDDLIAHSMVEWIGAVAPPDVAGHLATFAAGLTAYTDTAFNRASSPLKTMEYLAAGLPVVSSDLPASRWLDSAHVHVESSGQGFVAAVQQCIAEREDDSAEQARRDLAAGHSWRIRAETFLDFVQRAEAANRGQE